MRAPSAFALCRIAKILLIARNRDFKIDFLGDDVGGLIKCICLMMSVFHLAIGIDGTDGIDDIDGLEKICRQCARESRRKSKMVPIA